MQIIKPSAEYLDPAQYQGPLQFIEKVGRTCYKSEDRITPESARKFITDLAQKGHGAMLEHAFIYMTVTGRFLDMLDTMDPKDTRYIHVSGHKFSASLRAMYDMLENSSCPHNHIWRRLCEAMRGLYPEIFGRCSYDGAMVAIDQDFQDLSRTEFIDKCKFDNDWDALRECLPHTVLFHVDRGVTHELVRHRPASFAQESTRYCNYSKGKFGTEITVVEPFWVEDDLYKKAAFYADWKEGCRQAERLYMSMLAHGAVAQEARAVLPQSVKADIILTAVEAEWEHIINLRTYGTTGAPHPDMRRVMLMAAPLLRMHSDGRLYEKDLALPRRVADDSGRRYIFVTDADGDLMPLTIDGGHIMEVEDDAAGEEFVRQAEGIGLIKPGTASVLANPVLDKTENHAMFKKDDTLVYSQGQYRIL